MAAIIFYAYLMASGALPWNRQLATFHIRPWPLRLGSTVKADFHAHLRYPSSGITANLKCVEEATHSAGRTRTTKTATRVAIDLNTSGREWQFVIPVGCCMSS